MSEQRDNREHWPLWNPQEWDLSATDDRKRPLNLARFDLKKISIDGFADYSGQHPGATKPWSKRRPFPDAIEEMTAEGADRIRFLAHLAEHTNDDGYGPPVTIELTKPT
jgi:hypothetical protein